ncbi:hypothetical protein [Antrihabitans sp. YC2-6]|uniref:hypothetical protein n=1 Tax=Antrihabitans sp. YC2-6 TaxID=2799498 RepID=UPI0018F49991|nr:hypothetical protein [Antrihabitans sp. YC2-6]MBJ8348753.1 hypothetical protein [Antrihabitans sp. YC2-6]
MNDVLAPRFPDVALARPHYESVYLTAYHPTEQAALWIRHTIHKAPGKPPRASVWFTYFTPDAVRAGKLTTEDVRVGTAGAVVIGSACSMGLSGATGSMNADTIAATWDVRFHDRAEPMRHYPFDWMYSAPLPRTKSTSAAPSLRLSGSFTAAGHVVDVEGWRGTIGHNWGTQHAERWIWLRASGFGENPEAWLDVVIGKVRVGPIVTPWIANGMLSVDGMRERVGGLGALRSTKIVERTDGALITLGKIEVDVVAPPAHFVGWRYSDPGGHGHEVANCSIATMTVRGASPSLLHTHCGAYEIGGAEAAIDVELQPYED